MSNLTVKSETRKKTARKKSTRKKSTRRSTTRKTAENELTTAPEINSVTKEEKKQSLTQNELVDLVKNLEAKCNLLETKVANLENTTVNRKKLKSALKAVTKPSMAADLI
jgi:hypothetical protein